MRTATTAYDTFSPLSMYDPGNGETVKMVTLPLAAIMIPDFQRDRIPAHIAKMAAEWDAVAYCFPVVASFRGSLLCVDGQQRLAACELNAEERVSVLLVEGVKTEKRLAQLFLHLNRDRKLVRAFQKFVASLKAGDHGSLEIKELLAEFGKEMGERATLTKVPSGAIIRIHEQRGLDRVRRIMRVISEAWPMPSIEAHEGKTLHGIAAFMHKHAGAIDDERLIEILRRHHPAYLIEAASPKGRKTSDVAYSEHLAQLYNRGLRGKARL